jgi:hypothetical protein
VIHQSNRIEEARHPTRTPPQTTVEETVLDLTQTARDLQTAAAWLARAVGARLTTPTRLACAIARRTRVRWRRALLSFLADIADGCHSKMEVPYYRNVERAHGLPRGRRQVPTERASRRGYRDVEYREYATVVELDGRVAHPEPFRDMERDNATVEDRKTPLRYGYEAVVFEPCRVARQVGKVLSDRGWRGRPRRCKRRDCVIT